MFIFLQKFPENKIKITKLESNRIREVKSCVKNRDACWERSCKNWVLKDMWERVELAEVGSGVGRGGKVLPPVKSTHPVINTYLLPPTPFKRHLVSFFFSFWLNSSSDCPETVIVCVCVVIITSVCNLVRSLSSMYGSSIFS